MKRVTKSVTALLLALVLSLTLLPAQALAADTAPATQTYTGTAYVGAHTNPVYARVWKGVAETSLQTAPSAQTAVAAQAVDYLTETEAVAALRKQMVARKETMTLNVKLPSGGSYGHLGQSHGARLRQRHHRRLSALAAQRIRLPAG